MKISPEQLAEQLKVAIGADALSSESETLAKHRVAGELPALVCLPHSADQLASAVRVCTAAEASMVPWGGGTAMAIGNPPRRVDVVLSTLRLSRIIDHDHANLTVTVESGLALGALQTTLASQKQFVPFEPPFAERSTVGGIVAANLNGPRRSSLGSVRDLVIGMKVVLGSGEQIKAGGKVVKNVAGYDLCKLFTGSLGSLGIITEATVRVAPIPEQSATGIAHGNLTQASQLARELTNSKLLPTAVSLLGTPADQSWHLAVSFEGFGETVGRQIRELDSLTKQIGMAFEEHSAESEQRFWRQIGDLPLQADRLIYRVTVPPASVEPVLGAVQSSLIGAAEPTLSADIGPGTIWIVAPANRTSAEHFAELITLARQHHGHAILFAAPPELKHGVEVWGPSPPTIALMRDIKQRFDPHGILNPGRFIGGL
ncbi:MAG TPA: FAD-binding oxidoreductase [Candidatus Limnocylindrales bacterium]|nr:FAD-binding oxidoreductase [Candidatus Limnocylindrales bacterium]